MVCGCDCKYFVTLRTRLRLMKTTTVFLYITFLCHGITRNNLKIHSVKVDEPLLEVEWILI